MFIKTFLIVSYYSSTPIATNNLPNKNLNTPTKVKETTEQKSKESETECIENIQEAIHQSTMNSELATITKYFVLLTVNSLVN